MKLTLIWHDNHFIVIKFKEQIIYVSCVWKCIDQNHRLHIQRSLPTSAKHGNRQEGYVEKISQAWASNEDPNQCFMGINTIKHSRPDRKRDHMRELEYFSKPLAMKECRHKQE